MTLSQVHPDLRRAARLLPTWLPGLSGPRALGLVRRLAELADVAPTPGVTRTVTAYGDLHTPDRPSGLGGAVLWIHGGGLVLGTARQESPVAGELAARLGVPVLSAEYRLAPEHPFPTPLDDCYGALLQLLDLPGVDPAKVVVGGASAGGGLAAGLAQLVRERRTVTLAGQLLVYPMLDDRTCTRTPPNGAENRVWNNTSNRFAWGAYLGREPGTGGADAPVAPAVPGRATDLAGLPPAWIGVGTADLFHDEDVDYARRLEAAGVPCELGIVPGAFHGFDRVAPSAPVVREFFDRQVGWVRARLRSA